MLAFVIPILPILILVYIRYTPKVYSYVAYFVVLNMLINMTFALRPTSAQKKKLKSYGGGEPYMYDILEGVMFFTR